MKLGKYKFAVSLDPLTYLEPHHLQEAFEVSGGLLLWKVSRQGARKNRLAGCYSAKVPTVSFEGNPLPIAEVAYTVQTGKFPNGEVIHLNGDTSNVSISNLHVIPEHVTT
jgi:hypothetical protein